MRLFILSIAILISVGGCSTPSPKAVSRQQPDSAVTAALRDAQELYESGKLDAAENELQKVLAVEPENPKAHYYLTLVQQCQAKRQNQPTEPKPFGYYPTFPPKPIY